MKHQQTILTALLIALTGALSPLLADNAQGYSIKDVMKALHKGDDALCKKIAKGEGSKEEFRTLVNYYSALPKTEPPKGDAKAWREKANALLDAAKALEAGKPGALDQFKAAVNCKACHSAHKAE
ncbi:MAG: hypothetical protein ACKPGI_14975 [Verrucomicrobiota bacterium]